VAALLTWGIRNPATLLAALSLAAGGTEIANWALAFTGLMVFGIPALLSNRVIRGMQERSAAHDAFSDAADEARVIRGRFPEIYQQRPAPTRDRAA
jgi:hypothetical protein